MIVFNLDKCRLCKVVCKDIEESHYVIKTKVKLFGFTLRKYGVYRKDLGTYIGKELPKNYILKDDNVYLKPRVILYFEIGDILEYYFNFFEEAKKFTEELTKGKKWKTLY